MTENALFLLPALRRARDLIDREYAEPLDLDAMASEAGYSRFHFAREFTAAYGETPRTYLTRRRIERAKTLLRTANLSDCSDVHSGTKLPWGHRRASPRRRFPGCPQRDDGRAAR